MTASSILTSLSMYRILIVIRFQVPHIQTQGGCLHPLFSLPPYPPVKIHQSPLLYPSRISCRNNIHNHPSSDGITVLPPPGPYHRATHPRSFLIPRLKHFVIWFSGAHRCFMALVLELIYRLELSQHLPRGCKLQRQHTRDVISACIIADSLIGRRPIK